MSDFSNIASAPGDLMPEAVAARHDSLRGQFRHENTTVPLRPGAKDRVEIVARAGFQVNLVSAQILYTIDGSLPGDDADSVDMLRDTPPEAVPFAGPVTIWRGSIPPQQSDSRVRYRIRGTSADGTTRFAQDGQGFWFRYSVDSSVSTFAYRVGTARNRPEWLRSAVIYQVFLDRFRPGSGEFPVGRPLKSHHGGTIDGITRSLDYLEGLGATCIWISPFGPAASYHHYDATDYFSIDPRFGDVTAVRRLSEAAHKRGLRIILDFVPSHFSADHDYFKSAATDRESPYRDWFVWYEWPRKYRSFLEAVPQLVSLNTNHPDVRDYLIRSARFWMEVGVDGFRLDHVIGHGMDFWAEFQEALEEANPNVVTIGEATDTPEALRTYAGRMDAILDFPLARALRLTFGTREWSLVHLDGFLTQFAEFMHDGPQRVTFLDNHDMDRFLYVSGQDTDAMKLALVVLMTLPHAPVLYYGTEIGMTHDRPLSDRQAGGDELCRQDMIWDERRWDHTLLEFIKELVRARVFLGAAIGETRETIVVEKSLYAFRLGESAVVLINAAADGRDVRLGGGEASWRSLLASGNTPAVENGTITLAGRSATILVRP